MKTAKRTLAKGISTIYILSKDEDEYSIICVEENLNEKTTRVYECKHITPIKSRARGFFRKIISGKVFGITLIDIIYNLLD